VELITEERLTYLRHSLDNGSGAMDGPAVGPSMAQGWVYPFGFDGLAYYQFGDLAGL
jgi:hypothetical protein